MGTYSRCLWSPSLSRPGWPPECNCILTSNSDCCQQQQSCSFISARCVCDSVSVCKFHPGLTVFAPCRSVLGLDDSNVHVSMLFAGLNDYFVRAGLSGYRWLALFPMRCWSTRCGPSVNMCHDSRNLTNTQLWQFPVQLFTGKKTLSVTLECFSAEREREDRQQHSQLRNPKPQSAFWFFPHVISIFRFHNLWKTDGNYLWSKRSYSKIHVKM